MPEPSDAPGISRGQLRVCWEKFEAKVVTLAGDARSLMSEDKADLIVDVLRNLSVSVNFDGACKDDQSS